MSTQYISVGNAVPADISKINSTGFFLPLRDDDDPVLVTDCDGKKFGVFLESARICRFFAVEGRSRVGLHVPNAEIVVDLTSVARLESVEQRAGNLLVEDGKLSLYAYAVGDHPYDAEPLPLWSEIPGGTKGARAIYTRWAVAVRDGDKMHVLWERAEPGESSVQAY